MSSGSSVDPELLDQTRAQIRGLVQEIEHLAKSEVPPGEFYEGFLTRVVAALAAVGGAIWTLSDEGMLQLAYQLNLRQTRLGDSKDDQERHGRLLRRVLTSGQAQIIAPNSGAAEPGGAGNPTETLLLLGPVRNEQGVQGIVELFQRPGGAPAVERGYLRFLTQMCDLATDYLKARRLRSLSARQAMWTQLEQFTRQAHESLDPHSTAFTIANEGRRLIDCDRVTVAICRGSKCKVDAISGQELFNKRSNVVQLLNRVATAVVQSEEPLWYLGDTTELPPQIEQAVEEYIDESHSKMLAVIPLRKPQPSKEEQDDSVRPNKILGALIVEQIVDESPAESLRHRIDVVAEHSALALSNSLEHNSLFLMPVWRAIGKSRVLVTARNLPKTIAVLLAICVAAAALTIIQAPFNLHGRGTLEPVTKAEIFAPLNGTIKKLYVHDDQEVKAEERLADMQSMDLEVRMDQVRGQVLTATETRRGLESAALNQSLSREERQQKRMQINPQIAMIDSSTKQLEKLEEQKKKLQIASPITGHVLTWKVHDRLAVGRPVQEGQILMTIADPTGEWELEIHMPEDRMGYINEAIKDNDELNKSKPENERPGLKVYYIVVGSNVTHEGELLAVHPMAEVRGEEGNVVKLLVKINKADIPDLRAGTGVTAKIDCGSRSLGFVWFHDVISFIESRVLFRFF